MANPRTNPHPPGPSGRLPRRPPRHETLPPQNPPPEIQIRNPYYSNHSNNNHIFSLPKYLKYLIPQHSRLTGAVRPLSQSFKFRPSISPGSPPKRMAGHSITLSGLQIEIKSTTSLEGQWRWDSNIVEAIADTMFAFRGSSECLRPVGSGGLYFYPQAVTTSLPPSVSHPFL